jgi:beta-1,4-mannosyl-glycoprotein beta-1,4-N-acetylglucosaminyltransferase
MSNERKPRVYDMFPFFNELEILEIRLNELDPVVDVFILSEARHTFQKKPKELIFEKNKDRFARFLPKIRHIIVDELPGFFYKWRVPNAWHVSDYQKSQVVRGLYDAQDTDSIIFSDVDEIPKASAVAVARGKSCVTVFEQRIYAYYLNNICIFFDTKGRDCVAQYNRDGLGWWRGSVMMDYASFCKIDKSIKRMRLLHDRPEPEVYVMKDAGWHFSSIGDVERIALKLESYEHSEANTDENKNPELMRRRILEGKSIFSDNQSLYRLVSIDKTFPDYLLKNQTKFKHLIAST